VKFVTKLFKHLHSHRIHYCYACHFHVILMLAQLSKKSFRYHNLQIIQSIQDLKICEKHRNILVLLQVVVLNFYQQFCHGSHADFCHGNSTYTCFYMILKF
jgi:hypothetical protein